MYNVKVKKSVQKAIRFIPKVEQMKFDLLTEDLKNFGPVQSRWPNYGMIVGTNTHHCHLSHKWVACWIETEKGIEVEVTYVGSREGAPYAKH